MGGVILHVLYARAFCFTALQTRGGGHKSPPEALAYLDCIRHHVLARLLTRSTAAAKV